jgi:hypothetical protein
MTERKESSIVRLGSAVAGRGIALVFAAIKIVRHPRPLHPRGELFEGQIEWLRGTPTQSGVSWVDSPPRSGREDVTVRVSRSVGLTPPLPDVIGLAFRVATNHGNADLELASSWWGVPGRFLLRPGQRAAGAFSTVMPYRGDFGAVMIAARPTTRTNEQWDIDLFYGTSTSTWRRFAVMRLDAHPLPDRADLRFDPVLNAPPGARTYGWARRLRERSYAVARRER